MCVRARVCACVRVCVRLCVCVGEKKKVNMFICKMHTQASHCGSLDNCLPVCEDLDSCLEARKWTMLTDWDRELILYVSQRTPSTHCSHLFIRYALWVIENEPRFFYTVEFLDKKESAKRGIRGTVEKFTV